MTRAGPPLEFLMDRACPHCASLPGGVRMHARFTLQHPLAITLECCPVARGVSERLGALAPWVLEEYRVFLRLGTRAYLERLDGMSQDTRQQLLQQCEHAHYRIATTRAPSLEPHS